MCIYIYIYTYTYIYIYIHIYIYIYIYIYRCGRLDVDLGVRDEGGLRPGEVKGLRQKGTNLLLVVLLIVLLSIMIYYHQTEGRGPGQEGRGKKAEDKGTESGHKLCGTKSRRRSRAVAIVFDDATLLWFTVRHVAVHDTAPNHVARHDIEAHVVIT